MYDRAVAYGIPGYTVDGQDVLAVHDVTKAAVARARAGAGPTLIEAKTYRYEGHCGISSGHQNPEECAEWRARDPIDLFARKLVADGVMSTADQARMRDEVRAELDAAEKFAIGSPLADPECLQHLTQ